MDPELISCQNRVSMFHAAAREFDVFGPDRATPRQGRGKNWPIVVVQTVDAPANCSFAGRIRVSFDRLNKARHQIKRRPLQAPLMSPAPSGWQADVLVLSGTQSRDPNTANQNIRVEHIRAISG
ncbi:MAG: hypothetical protein U0R19_12155 [Bryobacteraceae bacterium]